MLRSFQVRRDIKDQNSFLMREDQETQREFNCLDCLDLQALRTGATQSPSLPHAWLTGGTKPQVILGEKRKLIAEGERE